MSASVLFAWNLVLFRPSQLNNITYMNTLLQASETM
jgi:hypothetical protein